VDAVLNDYRTASISEKDRALFALVDRINDAPERVSREDVERGRRAGWSDEALYDAITVCALFRFYNAWIDATGVQDLPAAMYHHSGRRLAADGYVPADG
jgi:alkylhydroperoxidase family enzyme